MIERIHVPRPPLSDVIALFWRVDGDVSAHGKELVLPTGGMQIIVSLRQDRFRVYDRQDPARESSLSGAILTGPYAEATIINTADVLSTIGVAFKPGGARPFFGVPAGELRDRDANLDALWGASAAGELRERLLEAGADAGARARGEEAGGREGDGADAQFAVLEEFLLARAAWSRLRHPAVAFAVREFDSLPHTRTIGDVTGQVGLSRRRFIELFENAVGLTPKRFCRLRRFQEVLGCVARGDRVDWAEVAAACGYCDQPHLIHDFRGFSGLTPGEYLRQRTAHQNHVRLD